MILATGLTTLDYSVCVLYLLGITGFGIYFFRGQRSTKDFFLAGRSMGWLPVGLSLMATLTSGIGFIAHSAGAVRNGLIMLWALMAIPLSFPVVIWVFMPFYHRLKVYTAYEYLERRFDVRVRVLTSGIFILWRVTWMAAAIYVPSMVLNAVTGGKLPLTESIIALGILATVYTALGGVKAVMWTDVVQFVVMFGGMITAALIIFLRVPGGIEEIWSTLQANGKTAMVGTMEGWQQAGAWGKMKLYLYTDVTVLAILITYTIQKMGNYCVDQAMVQRYLTAKSLRTSRIGFACNCFAYCFYIVSMTVVGASLIAVAAHYAFPENLGNDRVFPYFIANMMPMGIAGLMIAAIYASSMSSLDSGVNSCITAITNDFYNRLWKKRAGLALSEDDPDEDARQLRLARISTVVLGLVVTCLACYVGRLGSVWVISTKLINAFTGPLFGIFLLGMFTKRANGPGVLIGGLLGTALGGITIFADRMGLESFDIGVMWPATAAFITTLSVGYLLSLALGKPNAQALDWTWHGVMRANQST